MSDNGFSDKVKGTVNKVKGEAKDQIGNATNNTSLQAEGKVDKLKGKTQEKISDMKEKFSDTDND